jgi:hypothetical protein
MSGGATAGGACAKLLFAAASSIPIEIISALVIASYPATSAVAAAFWLRADPRFSKIPTKRHLPHRPSPRTR